jgi:hypothetical protein
MVMVIDWFAGLHKEDTMINRKHSLFFSFAALLIAAVFSFILPGCSTDGGGSGGSGDWSVYITVDSNSKASGTHTVHGISNMPRFYCKVENISGDISFQWNKDGSAIPDETTNSYRPTESGDYTVTATVKGKSKTSDTVTIILD